MIRELELTAYHEAGHAVAQIRTGLGTPFFVTISQIGDVAGYCAGDIYAPYGPMELGLIEACVIGRLAGPAAQLRRCRWSRIGAGLQVMRTARCVIRPEATPDSDVPRAITIMSPYCEDPGARVEELWDPTWRLITKHWREVQGVALALLDHETVSADELDRLVSPTLTIGPHLPSHAGACIRTIRVP